MYEKPKPDKLKTAFYVLSFLAISIGGVIFYQYKADNKALIKTVEVKNRIKADSISNLFNHYLTKIQRKVDNLASGLSDQSVNDTARFDTLRSMMYSNPGFVEAGIAYKPFKIDSTIRLVGVAYTVEGNKLKEFELDDRLDYTNPDVYWYNSPIINGSIWLEPEYAATRSEMLSIYATPLTRAVNSPIDSIGMVTDTIGVLYLKLSLSDFSRTLDALDLGEGGSYFIATRKNKYILNSKNALFIHNEKESEIPDWADKKRRKHFGADSETTFSRFLATETGLESVLLLTPIKVTDWKLGLYLNIADHILPPSIAKRKVILFGFALGLGCLFFLIPFFDMHKFDVKGLWKLSFAFSGFCLFMLILVLSATLYFPKELTEKSERITSQHSLDEFKIDHAKKSLSSREELPVYIPTGVFIQAVTFIDAFDVQLMGYIWQRYTDGIHDSVSRGVIMPEGEQFEPIEVFRKRNGNTEHIGWRFQVILHEKFDYSRYPFARENIWIQLWHKDFHDNVILVPDLEGYDETTPLSFPGLLKDLEIPGWDIESSNFSIKTRSDKSNFGFMNNLGPTHIPELFFNIHIIKEITGPLVTHIIPLSIVLILLLSILLLTNKDDDKKELFGFNTLSVIATCAGFFLVVVFSHIDLRENLSTKGIVYIEYYYFIIYVFILGVALNSLIYTLTDNRLVNNNDNQYLQMLFLPLSQAAILIMTLVKFY
jgi:hypothetical protein